MRNSFLILCALSSLSLFAVAQKSIQDTYRDFTIYRTTKGNTADVIRTKALLALESQLTPKQLTNVLYHLGRMHEEIGDVENAASYYEKSLKGEPNYYVTHRALGFIYLKQSTAFVKLMNEASVAKNTLANAKAFDQYKSKVQKALVHLENIKHVSPMTTL